jgi:hypothetical protein
MDALFPVAPGVARLTVNLDEDDVPLFDDLWPVPHGVALHAYLVEGRRRVLVDPWNAGGYGVEEIEADLVTRGLRWKDIDAVAFTKAPAPGLVEALKAARPGLEVWGAPSPGVRHDLGGVAFEERGGFWTAQPAGVVLTGDAFAGLGWIEDEGAWAERLTGDAARHLDDEALRWFCLRPLVPALPEEAKIVAPAHGCLFGQPATALERARKFENWASGDGAGELAVVWPAGADRDAGFDALVGAALTEGAPLSLYRVPGDDPTALAAGARRASLVVLAAGLDAGFLKGLTKDVWRPDPAAGLAALRAGLADHWQVP